MLSIKNDVDNADDIGNGDDFVLRHIGCLQAAYFDIVS